MKLDPNSREELPAVVREVAAERRRQDAKWGGPQHDDEHSLVEFVQWIEDYAGWARAQFSALNHEEAERRLIQVAALAVAAVESNRRKRGAAYNADQPDEPSAKPMPTALDRRGWYVKDLEDTLATIAKAVGLDGEPDADALIATVKELAKPMPTRKEMEERACTWFVDEYGIAAHARVRALIDYLLDGEAR